MNSSSNANTATTTHNNTIQSFLAQFKRSKTIVWVEPNHRKNIIFTVLLGIVSFLPIPVLTLFTGGLPHFYLGQTPKALILSLLNLLAHVPFVFIILPVVGWTFVVLYFWLVIFALRFIVSLYFMLDAVYLHSRLLRNFPITQGECSFLFYTVPFRWLMKQPVFVSQSNSAPQEVLYVQQQVETMLHQNRGVYTEHFVAQVLQQYMQQVKSSSAVFSGDQQVDPYFHTSSSQDGIVYISNDQPSTTAFDNAKFYPSTTFQNDLEMNTVVEASNEQREMTKPFL